MNISYNWLSQYFNSGLSPEDLAKLLTGCGLEVEGIETFESVKGGLKNLVVGEVLETSKHPNADRLTVTRVNLGNGELSQIVCGAPNVAAGQKVIVATPGTTIFPLKGEPFEIKKSKIRGEASEGMICAEDEIGLGESHEGILVLDDSAVPGKPVTEYFKVETDHMLSIGLTPNRPDAASHIGVARDVRAVVGTQNLGKEVSALQFPDLSKYKSSDASPVINVRVESEACTRYTGVHIRNVKVTQSPQWLQNRLKAVGLTPINNIVDITNFVLYEYGQPLHAFDADVIGGAEVVVRMARQGEKFVTLDGVERDLKGIELMICDQKEGMCIAGVFGGINSGVTEKTTSVFLESACFDPVSIRKTSKLHGLNTDASFRFERGTDPNITVDALKRAAILITEIAGGEVTSQIVDVYPTKISNWKIYFRYDRFRLLTGVDMQRDQFISILSLLDIRVVSQDGDVLKLEVPPYRVDVMREADIVEEVLRIYGYDRIPLPSKMNTSLPNPELVPLEKVRDRLAGHLVANGYQEVMCNSLFRSSAYGERNDLARIKNPLSADLDIMRRDMLLPLLEVAAYNRNRKRPDLQIFEFGKTYQTATEGFSEQNHLALMLTGSRNDLHWEIKSGDWSVYYLKSVLENLIITSGAEVKNFNWQKTEHPDFETALILSIGSRQLAVAGNAHRKLVKQFDLEGLIWFADIDLDALESILRKKAVKILEPPKFPEVRRDLSMVLDRGVQYTQLETLAFDTERKLLREVVLFDVYEGEKLGEGKKSYALSFVLRDDEKTLTDKEIDKTMNRLMDAFENKLSAVIRKG
jgi:phenylalanyl-tRNA synthetase beta chain